MIVVILFFLALLEGLALQGEASGHSAAFRSVMIFERYNYNDGDDDDVFIRSGEVVAVSQWRGFLLPLRKWTLKYVQFALWSETSG